MSQQDPVRRRYNPLVNPANRPPVFINERVRDDGQAAVLLRRPLLGALVFNNTSSDARDHCANERTFLSWLRMSMYLSLVAVAIMISFHFRAQPTALERRMALPLSVVFWVLSLVCLVNGCANYVLTVTKYSRRAALVQSGWKTQLVFAFVATVILGSCVLFLATNRTR